MTVRLLDGSCDECGGLTSMREYLVLGIEADDYRILNDDGEHGVKGPLEERNSGKNKE